MSAAAEPTLTAQEEWSAAGPFYRISRGVLLAILFAVFGGAMSYLNPFSPLLLYAGYAVIAAGMAACLGLHWPVSRQLESVAPYLYWMLAYFVWGILAAADGSVLREGLKEALRNFLVIGALALALERGTLRTFAKLVQLAVLLNVALCLWETFDPSLIETIAFTREADATAYNVLRPGGLWSNPDEAAFAYIFSLLLSRWAGKSLGIFGALGALVGLYLSASRTGIYLLLLCAAAYGWRWLKAHRPESGRLAAWCTAALVALVGGAALFLQRGVDLSENWQVQRFLDFQENSRYIDDASRTQIAWEALRTIFRGPWFGSGLFSFQCEPNLPDVLDIPAHNVFLVVWGEAGALIFAAYLAVMVYGFTRAIRTPMPEGDRLTVALLWICYVIIGVTWHNQFTNFSGMLYIALLWRLPPVLETPA